MEETLGKRIAACRKKLSLTQDALAEKLGITAQAVSKWENDQSCPDISMLPKLADIFAVSTDELLGVQRTETPMAEVTENPSAEAEDAAPAPTRWKALVSPAAAFAFWLFLTGLVALIDAIRPFPCDLIDIVIACGVFTFGLFGLFRQFSLLRLGCAVAGGAFIFHLIGEPGLADIDWTVPLAAAVALLGLDLLIQAVRKQEHKGFHQHAFPHPGDRSSENHCTYDGESFDCTTCFGEDDRQIQLPRLSGGNGKVTFGELHIDLTHCGEIADGCKVGLECSFGSLEIWVPRQYRVEIATSVAFGTVDEKGASDSDAESTIHLNCKVSFGEISVRHI